MPKKDPRLLDILRRVIIGPYGIFLAALLLLSLFCVSGLQPMRDFVWKYEVSRWIDRSQSGGQSGRRIALKRLAEQQEYLIDMLQNSNPAERAQYAFILGKIGGRRAVPALIIALDGSERNTRGCAASALGEIGDALAVPALIHALKFDKEIYRPSVVEALDNIGAPEALLPLMEALQDADESVRWIAASALGRIGDKRAVSPLLFALGDPHEQVRASAVAALAKIGDERAKSALLRLSMTDSSSHVKTVAVDALTALEEKLQEMAK